MLSNEQIKDRFYNSGKLIGVDGQFVEQNWDTTYYNPGTIKLLHYRLLDGVSDEALMTELKNVGLAPLEVKFALKKAHAFISDILGVDLTDHRASQISTIAACHKLLEVKIADINQRFTTAINSPIMYRDYPFDADQASQMNIMGSATLNKIPTYWVNSNNERVEPWTLEDCQALGRAIFDRKSKWHLELTQFKETARQFADAGKLNDLQALTLEFVQ